MVEAFQKRELRKIPWTAVLGGIGLLSTGLLAWDDVGDTLQANAQSTLGVTRSLEIHIDNEETEFVRLWGELNQLDGMIEATEDDLQTLQQQLIEQTADNKVAVGEIRSDVKSILRLLQQGVRP